MLFYGLSDVNVLSIRKHPFMKKIFTLFFLSCCTWATYAQQTTFLQQDFESYPGYNITDWQHVYSAPVPFRAGYPYLTCLCAPDVTKAAAATGNGDAFMASPVMNMTGHNNVWLQYDCYFQKVAFNGTPESATVEISIDSGATWHVVQDVPANTNLNIYKTYFVDISAYANHNKVRMAYRYTNTQAGWAVDNIKVFAPAARDLKLKRIIPDDSLRLFQTQNEPFSFGGTVMNYGLDNVSAFDIKYTVDNGPVANATITGVSIAPFDTMNFMHTVPYTVTSVGNHQVKMWVELAGDNVHNNDSLRTLLQGAAFMPKKKLLIEEGTGSWCDQGTRGIAFLDALKGGDYAEACLISEHRMDSMVVADYDDYLFKLRWNFVPYFLFDRRMNVAPDVFFTEALKQMQYFGFADLQMKTEITGNKLNVTTTIVPAIDLHGDMRLAVVLTENGVHKDMKGWEQANFYAGGAGGPMGGFENKPNPIPAAEMYYNRVARMVAPHPGGIKGLLPKDMLHNQSYSQTIVLPLNPAWDRSKLRAIVMLIGYTAKDSAVLNSNQMAAVLSLQEQSYSFAALSIYPNPATNQALLAYQPIHSSGGAVSLTDITGKIMYQLNLTQDDLLKGNIIISTADLVPGLYFVTLSTSDGRKETLKLQVMR